MTTAQGGGGDKLQAPTGHVTELEVVPTKVLSVRKDDPVRPLVEWLFMGKDAPPYGIFWGGSSSNAMVFPI